MNVSEILENWYNSNKRDLPWRSSGSAYHIWLSEIILQQTRVNQGLEYYYRFLKQYPSVTDLASASIDDILKLWQGLGYYSRARNMHKTAIRVVENYNGIFPSEVIELLKLKGIGTYTAAAISSIAYKKPVALVDGNVYRVLARVFNIAEPIDSSKGRNLFNKLAHEILNIQRPDIHNQAIMEFGALVCLPQKPLCNQCVLSELCIARRLGTYSGLPVKKAKKKNRIRYFNYLFIIQQGMTFLNRRDEKDIWHSLYEFPLIETSDAVTVDKLRKNATLPFRDEINLEWGNTRTYRHQLTHQTLICSFTLIHANIPLSLNPSKYIPVSISRLTEYAVPRAIDRYLVDLRNDGLL
jgi:A/G-specific adenine glycosylase